MSCCPRSSLPVEVLAWLACRLAHLLPPPPPGRGGTRPLSLEVRLDAAALRAWSQPGWVKVGMEFHLQPSPVSTLLSTETRILATDPRARRAFAAYWWFIRPASGAIRREVLRIVAQGAASPPRDR